MTAVREARETESDPPMVETLDGGPAPDPAAAAAGDGGDGDAPFELDEDVGGGSSGPPPLRYDGFSLEIPGLPTRSDLVRRAGGGALSEDVAARVAAGETVFFMPNGVEEQNEYVRGVPVYKLHLFGALPDGSKAHVVLDDVDVYFDVRVPEASEALPPDAARCRGPEGDFGARLRQVLLEGEAAAERVADVEGLPGRGYRRTAVGWKRLYFPNTQKRKTALSCLRDLGYETASDDLTNYHRMVARVYGLVLTDWAVMANYAYFRGGAHPQGASTGWGVPLSPLCEHVFRVSVEAFAPLVDPMAPMGIQGRQAEARRSDPALARDRTLVQTWDIETYSAKKTGDLPRATNPEDRVFMVGVTAHWKDDAAPLLRVCIVDVPTEPDERWTTVECGSEENVVRAFAVVYRHLAPDIIAGFNDGDYDWPFIIETARRARLLAFLVDTMSALPRRTTTEEGVLRWNVQRDKKIKVSAEETAVSTFLKIPGSVPVDVRTVFRQLFPKAEVGKGSSLNFYLKACNLPLKADMPHTRMWHIYETRDSARMRHVAHYCVVDARRCQDLLVKRNVVNERREIAALSYVSFYDAVYYAGGHKVCNMLIAYAIRRGILCSSISRAEGGGGKYPGAWVFPPEKGLVPDPSDPGTRALEAARAALVGPEAGGGGRTTGLAEKNVWKALEGYDPGRPVTGLDFSSLYPSIIMAYNLSPEKFVEDPAEARRLEDEGVDLFFTTFEFQGRPVQGWFVRHGNDPAKYGLYASILSDLFDKRAGLKKRLVALEGAKEHMEVLMGRAEKAVATGEASSSESALAGAIADELAADAGRNAGHLRDIAALDRREWKEAFQGRYRDTCFDYAAVDSKQKALKTYMNTFYGEAGNSISPFFLLQLAGGVTTAGQYNIKMVADFVAAKGFRIKYGDSVAGDTPLVVRRGGGRVVDTARVDELVGADAWALAPGGKEEAAPPPGLEVWQDGGFTPVTRLIRHAVEGPLVRVQTHAGLVDCTADHSLLRPDGRVAAPGDVRPGDSLLHADDRELLGLLDAEPAAGAVPAEEAFAMGLFMADGSCGVRRRGGRRKETTYSWAIEHGDPDVLGCVGPCLPFQTRVERLPRTPARLVPAGDPKGPALRYRALLYNTRREKRVPTEVLGGDLDVAFGFWDGFLAGDGHRAKSRTVRRQPDRYEVRGKEAATGLWLLARRLGWAVSVDDCADGPDDVFRLAFAAGAQPPPGGARRHAVRKVSPLAGPGRQYVYDLETGSHHFHVGPGDLVVHNTDSLYLTCPSDVFREVDRGYAFGDLSREEYWTAMVEVSMREMDTLRDAVNAHLREDNGTDRLRMAYEEVLFPVIFSGKKKYAGIAHYSVPNFYPKRLFVRGIDVVKQGQTELTKKIGNRIMWAAVALDNTRDLVGIVEDVLRDGVENGEQWVYDDFVQSDAWKPNKDNKAVQAFVARMKIRVAEEEAENRRRVARGEPPRKALHYIPDPGERFTYVLVKPGAAFDLRGLKASPKKGDVMEYAEVAKARGIPPDVGRYLANYVVGLCARFINYAERFLPPPHARRGADEKALDKLAQDAAKKYLTGFIAGLQSADPETVRKRGYAYRRAWKNAAHECGARLREALGPGADVLHGGRLAWDDFLLPDDGEIVQTLSAGALRLAADTVRGAAAGAAAETAARLGIGPDGADLEPALGRPATEDDGGGGRARNLYAVAARLGGRAGRRGRPPTTRAPPLPAPAPPAEGARRRPGRSSSRRSTGARPRPAPSSQTEWTA